MKIGRKAASLFWSAVVIAVAVLTWVGLEKAYPDIAQWRYLPDRLFRLVKTLTGNDPVGGGLEAPDVPWQLIVAKLLVTLVIVRGLMKLVGSVFRDNVTQMRLLFKARPTVVIGAGRKGRAIAADLKRAHGETAVVVERDAAHKALAELRRAGHLVLTGDATTPDVLRSAGVPKAARVICFASAQNVGVQAAGGVRELWAGRTAAEGAGCDCYLHLDNARLVDLLRGRARAPGAAVRMHFFNLHKMTARSLFQRLATDLAEPMAQGVQGLRVDLLGFGPEAQALLTQGLRVLHLGLEGGVQWHVWTEGDPQAALQQLLALHPGAGQVAQIRFHAREPHERALAEAQRTRAPGTLGLVIAALPEDEANLCAAAEVLHAAARDDLLVYARCADDNGLPALLGGADEQLRLFGDLAQLCTVEMICGERQDVLARAIHADYLRLVQGTASESAAYKAAWEALDEDARDANRAQADHIPFKLMLLGGDAARIDDVDAEALEALAATEHERWAAHRLLAGWNYGPERDDARRLHPSLIPWGELSEGEREKDRDTVRRLPQLLALSKTAR